MGPFSGKLRQFPSATVPRPRGGPPPLGQGEAYPREIPHAPSPTLPPPRMHLEGTGELSGQITDHRIRGILVTDSRKLERSYQDTS